MDQLKRYIAADEQMTDVMKRNAEYELAKQMASDYEWKLIHQQEEYERYVA